MRRTLIGELACDVLLGDSSPLYARLYSGGLINGTFGYSFDTLPGVAYAYIGGVSNDPHAVADAVLQEAEQPQKQRQQRIIKLQMEFISEMSMLAA